MKEDTKDVAHTPGPWRLVQRKEGWVVKAQAGCVLAGVSQFNPPAELAPQCVHNARLIAASPNLLSCLRRLLEQVNSLDDYTLTRDALPYKAQACWDDAIRDAEAAITAAT